MYFLKICFIQKILLIIIYWFYLFVYINFNNKNVKKSMLMVKVSKNMVRVFYNGLWIVNFYFFKYGQKLIFYIDR